MNFGQRYGYVLIAFIAVMICCSFVSAFRKNKYSKSVTKLLIGGIISASLYCGTLYVDNEFIARILFAGNFLCSNFLLILFLKFVLLYSELKIKCKPVLVVLWITTSLVAILYIVNIFTGILFTITIKVSENLGIAYWAISFKKYFYYALGYSYILVLLSVGVLFYRTITSSSLYRGKYVYILIFSLLSLVQNALVYFFIRVPYDFSIAIYSILGIVISYYALYSIPKSVIHNTNAFVVDDMNVGVLCFDVQNKCISSNKKARYIFQVEGIDDTSKFENYLKSIYNKFEDRTSAYEQWEEVFVIEEENRFMFIEYYKVKDKKNEDIGCFLMVQDRTDEVRTLQEQQHKATHDELTDLYNRKNFFVEGRNIVNRLISVPKLMIAFNINDFKIVNDLFGVKFGDLILVEMAKIIKNLATEGSICGRISGDRFAMILHKKSYNEREFLRQLDKLQDLFEDVNYKINISMGIYEISNTKEPVESMYDKADMAINSLKGSYVSSVASYDTAIMDRILHDKNMLDDFDIALNDDQFILYLQPQFDTNGIILGAEALVRWKHPINGLIFPGNFIPIFENAGVIYKLDRYMWEKAAMKLRDWREMGKTNLHISVNVSANDLFYLDVYQEFVDLVEKYDINPRNLKIEITETAMMSDATVYFALFNKLRRYGFYVEIDDFGSGYSSLNMIKDVPADILKLDMIFLKEGENKDKNYLIIKLIIDISKSLGMQIIAEGVETKEQFDALVDMGCDMFQGYYFDKPISIKDFEDKYFRLKLVERVSS